MRLRIGRRAGAVAGLLLAARPVPAHAHLVNTGLGAFHDGLLHLVASLEDLLPVIALGLWAGLRGPHHGRAVLLTLPVAWLTGSLAVPAIGLAPTAGAWTATFTVVLGLLAAADGRLPRAAPVGAAVLLGVLHGALNGAALERAGIGWAGAAGIACAVAVVVSLGAAAAASRRTFAGRVVVRVAGSWIAATGLLMLGWALRA